MAEQNMEHLRHTLAHLMAAAVTDLWPDAKPTLGPPIEYGFYYDFEFASPISEEDLPRIEARMRELLPTWTDVAQEEVPADAAKERYADNAYKRELVDEIVGRDEPVTFCTIGGFADLCGGGHAEHPAKDIKPDAFCLHRIAGAYWRGDEKNTMLTRIYGLAFTTKEELDAHLAMLEEAKARDHKVLGPQLDLFSFSDLVGSGLPLWTPKGTLLRDILDDFVWELREKAGYERVEIPHITKKELYVTSGHWEKFQDDLFKIQTREGHEFAMKPMNCPHHTQIYARRQWSYRELPQRYANTTMCYRDEQTGEISGLARVRAFTQDDAHVFCRMDQAKEEFLKIWDIVHEFYGAFGFDLTVRLSRHDPERPELVLGEPDKWETAERTLQEIVDSKGAEYIDGLGEAAFYGPKLDFLAKDSLGREWQVATIQLDMNMPESFDLTCVNEKAEKERIVMIHAAIMGSIERFLAIAIEHYGGVFPTWLAPVQVRIIPVGEGHVEAARAAAERLRAGNLRVEVDESNESVGKKVRSAETDKLPYAAVIGDKEATAGTVAVRRHGGEDLGTMPVDDFSEHLKQEVASKAA